MALHGNDISSLIIGFGDILDIYLPNGTNEPLAVAGYIIMFYMPEVVGV